MLYYYYIVIQTKTKGEFMKYTNDDKEVIHAFMNQKEIKSYKVRTDGQSLFVGDLRVAEHYPHGDGTATTLLYDYTERGNAFVDKQVQWIVYQVKNLIPYQNLVKIPLAESVGLVPPFIHGDTHGDTPSQAQG